MALSGKVIVITGGARGMGRAYTLGFLEQGCKVVTGDLSWAGDGAEELRATVESAGGLVLDLDRRRMLCHIEAAFDAATPLSPSRTTRHGVNHQRRSHRGRVRRRHRTIRHGGRSTEQRRHASAAHHPAARHRHSLPADSARAAGAGLRLTPRPSVRPSPPIAPARAGSP